MQKRCTCTGRQVGQHSGRRVGDTHKSTADMCWKELVQMETDR
jgi:hypothetical protein